MKSRKQTRNRGRKKKKRISENQRPCYLPTKKEIKKRCEEIQKKWSDAEKQKRIQFPVSNTWELPELSFVDSETRDWFREIYPLP